ncbi:MAG: hypothetical protein N4A74_25740 [Carboxylicivirga sp.]|jgi:hypothetical protein|nr:hypothetical protein [Carboxylicivirga sp.]
MKLDYKILKTGYWLQGNQKVEVNILEIGIDYEREFKKFEYEDVSHEPVRLNETGNQYIITYGDISDLSSNPFFFSGSLHFAGLTIDEAFEKTKTLWGPIVWD